MLRLIPLAALAGLTGCLGPSEFRGWSEGPYQYTNCSGAPNGIAACFERAREKCPQGFQLAEMRSDPDINRHAIIVHCGPPRALPPVEGAPDAPAK